MSKRDNTVHTQFDPTELESKEPGAPERTRQLDEITDDSLGDHEGAARRASTDISDEFPEWVYRDYELKRTNYYGNPWHDGKAHLVPKATAIASAMDVYRASLETLPKAEEAAMKDTNYGPMYTTIFDAYVGMIHELGAAHHYDIVASVGDIATNALARRAYQRAKLMEQMARQRADDTSDRLENAQDRAIEASYRAAIWVKLYRTLYAECQWKGEPQFSEGRIRSAIVREYAGFAQRYIEPTHRNTKAEAATLGDHAKLLENF